MAALHLRPQPADGTHPRVVHGPAVQIPAAHHNMTPVSLVSREVNTFSQAAVRDHLDVDVFGDVPWISEHNLNVSDYETRQTW